MRIRILRLLGSSALLIALVFVLGAGDAANTPQYTKEGKLLRPDYRQWTYLSSGLGMNYGPGAAGAQAAPAFTNVFVNPESYRQFQKSGKWPDKTMFALEIYGSATHSSPNKNGFFQDTPMGLEFNVKDSAFPEGWRFFNFDGESREGTAIPKEASCMTCHTKNAAVENSFGQFYPTVLKVAMEKGTVKPGVHIPLSGMRFAQLIEAKGWAEAEKAYAEEKKSEDFALTEPVLNQTGYHLLSMDDTKTAIQLFELVTREHPESPNAWDSLADGYAAANRNADAIAATQKELALLPSAKGIPDMQKQRIEKAAKERLAKLQAKQK
jgi:tetratricopeptide (TPR) repeat protein